MKEQLKTKGYRRTFKFTLSDPSLRDDVEFDFNRFHNAARRTFPIIQRFIDSVER